MPVFSLDEGTLPEVGKALEHLLAQQVRCRIWYGDTETGLAWPDEYDVTGYIGRSTGTRRVPLMIHDTTSIGGGAILTAKILRIDVIWARQTLYKHPLFHTKFENAVVSKMYSDCGVPYDVFDDDGEHVAAFRSESSARRWIAFMRGERYAK